MTDKKPDVYRGVSHDSNLSAWHNSDDVTPLFKRAERLTSALYLISSFIPDPDPLKTKLRTSAISLLSDVLEGGRFYHTPALQARVVSLTALLSVAESGGYISPMNAEILRQKYVELGAMLRSSSAATASLLSGSLEAPPPARQGQDGAERFPGKLMSQKVSALKDKRGRRMSKGNEERKPAILSIIKDKGKASIKDIAKGISGCSEKTLQREVLALIAEGVLKKEGERRWTLYSPAK